MRRSMRSLGAVIGAGVAMVLVWGCGGTSTSEEPRYWHSGSRLRARVHDAGDGALLFVGWHDAKLDVDCRFAKAEDGKDQRGPSDSAARSQLPNYFVDWPLCSLRRSPTRPTRPRAGTIRGILEPLCFA